MPGQVERGLRGQVQSGAAEGPRRTAATLYYPQGGKSDAGETWRVGSPHQHPDHPMNIYLFKEGGTQG